MLKFLKIVEIVWLVVAGVSAIELFNTYDRQGDAKWFFGGFMILAVLMFFWRRSSRRKFERHRRERSQQESEQGTNSTSGDAS